MRDVLVNGFSLISSSSWVRGLPLGGVISNLVSVVLVVGDVSLPGLPPA